MLQYMYWHSVTLVVKFWYVIIFLFFVFGWKKKAVFQSVMLKGINYIINLAKYNLARLLILSA